MTYVIIGTNDVFLLHFTTIETGISIEQQISLVEVEVEAEALTFDRFVKMVLLPDCLLETLF